MLSLWNRIFAIYFAVCDYVAGVSFHWIDQDVLGKQQMFSCGVTAAVFALEAP